MGANPPDRFDLVVSGTGLTESLVAAAAARQGCSVLHVDPNHYYGSQNATVALTELLDLLGLRESGTSVPDEPETDGRPREGANTLPELADCTETAVSQAPRPARSGEVYQAPGAEALDDVCRGVQVDLWFQPLYCSGPTLEALVASGAHHYVEFRLVESTRVLDSAASVLRRLPASRGAVFRDTTLGPADKRALMRLLRRFTDTVRSEHDPLSVPQALRSSPFGEKGAGGALQGVPAAPAAASETADARSGSGCGATAQGRPLLAYLESEGLRPAMSDMITYGICGASWKQGREVPGEAPGATDPQRCQLTEADAGAMMGRWAASLGQLGSGDSPYMATIYGSGELPQALCRASAVAGSTYMLRQGVASVFHEPGTDSIRGVRLQGGQVVACKAFVGNWDTVGQLLDCTAWAETSRAVAVLDGPVIAGEDAATIILPPGSPGTVAGASVRMTQIGPALRVTPGGRCVLYLQCAATDPRRSARQDLLGALKTVATLDEDGGGAAVGDAAVRGLERRPRCLMAVFFKLRQPLGPRCGPGPGGARPSNAVITGGPGLNVALWSEAEEALGVMRALASTLPSLATHALFPTQEGRARPDDDLESGDQDLDALTRALGDLGEPQPSSGM
ncbi:unnamed protein product [Pedinophyceae sp. YPF-701]|nr:unnamed protein product [Pedinophyceae sp. YPF-701]